MKQITIHAQVDRPTKTALQKLAKTIGVSVSDIVRFAVVDYLKVNSQSGKGEAA